MNGALKITVNGTKFLITGVQRNTSCKNLLCAIAKATSSSSAGSDIGNREHCNSSILDRLILECQSRGDLDSLKVFRGLGKDARIVVKRDSSSDTTRHHERKKHRKHHSKKHRHIEKTVRFVDHQRRQSVDDLAVEKHKHRSKRKHDQKRYFEDSDIDVYRTLNHSEQKKLLKRLSTQSKSRGNKRNSWMENVKDASQVYFIDAFTEKMKIDTFLHDDDENDSGLPSPDFDSSESQHDTDPLKRKRIFANHKANIERLFSDQIAFIEDEIEKTKQEADCSCQSNSCLVCSAKLSSESTTQNAICCENTEELKLVSNNADKSLELRADVLLDINENVLTDTTIETNMVALNASMFEKPIVETIKIIEKGKKLEKKKIKKRDISQPVLLSPSHFTNHSTLTRISKDDTKQEETSTVGEQQKEKKYNKKIKDLRRSIRSRTSKDKNSEPEYVSKDSFLSPTLGDDSPLEYNVFGRKSKKKDKTKSDKKIRKRESFDESNSQCDVENSTPNEIDDVSASSQITTDDSLLEKSREELSNLDESIDALESLSSLSLETTNTLEECDERTLLENEYIEESLSLLELEERILDLAFYTADLTEELDIFDLEQDDEDLDAIERVLCKDMDDVMALLRSVTDLTTYQRKEMHENMKTLDDIELQMRTCKASFDNIRNGSWKTNCYRAPRSLLKNAKKKEVVERNFSLV